MMVTIEREYDIAFVEDTQVSGVWHGGDGVIRHSVRGCEVSRADYKLWLDAQDEETRRLMEPAFYSVCN